MLNKPKFMIPSTNRQECTIDLNEGNIPFSCIVDGNEAVVAWQVIVYDINNGKSVFDSGRVALDIPFYPIDEKNRNVVFNINLKYYLVTKTTLINRKDAYCWTITFWGTSECSTTSCEEVFYASTKPTVTISYRENKDSDYIELSENTIFKSRACYFKGNYSQENGVGLKRYGWRLCDIDSGQVLVDTIAHNQIYGTKENIICFYDGFLNGGKYSVELYIETQDNTTIRTGIINFTVTYSTTSLNSDIRVEALKNEPAVMLDWNEAVIIGGRNEGDVTFKSNYPIIDYSDEEPNTSVNIPANSRIIFDYGSSSNLNIDENSYIVLSTQLLNGDESILFYAEGNDDDGFSVLRKLTFSNGIFEYVVKGSGENIAYATHEAKYHPNQYVWYIIIMSPIQKGESGNYYTELVITESRLVNGLYPSPTLYPSENLYPTAGVWDKLKGVE